MMEKIDLTRSQKNAILKIKTGKNIFLEGFAGTGKTFLLKNLSKILDKNVRLTATTGMAAINLGGYTISSCMALNLGLYDLEEKDIKKKNATKWEENTLIVIDEVTMLSEEQFSKIDFALRCRGKRNKIFGGFQIVISGDFKQMPHIGWGRNIKNSIFMKNFEKVNLKENVRQKDDQSFFEILKKVRDFGFSSEVLRFIKRNHNQGYDGKATTIVATRRIMDEMNAQLMPPDKTEKKIFECDPKDPEKPYKDIKIWLNMPVIITKNNLKEGYSNGDTGVVVSFKESACNLKMVKVRVKLDRNGSCVEVSFSEKTFEIWEGGLLEEKTYEYMPLLPAHYLSIRRCQGLTLNNGTLHHSILNAELFNKKDKTNIQYVALSRFEKINQVHVCGF